VNAPSFARGKAAHLALGRAGERAAARYLESQFCRVAARNCRTGAGELDIVALDGAVLLFVEVKTLREKPGFAPAGNLSLRQRRRNLAAAGLYLEMIGRNAAKVRFDLIEVVFRGRRVVGLRRHRDYIPGW